MKLYPMIVSLATLLILSSGRAGWEEDAYIPRKIVSHLEWGDLAQVSQASKSWYRFALEHQREEYKEWIQVFPRGPHIHTFLTLLDGEGDLLLSENHWPKTLEILRYYSELPTISSPPFFMRLDFLRGETSAVGAAVLKTRPLWGWIASLDPDPEGQRQITDVLGRGTPPQIVAVGEDLASFFGGQITPQDCAEILEMLFEHDEARIRDVAKSLRETPMIDGEWGFTRFVWITLWLH